MKGDAIGRRDDKPLEHVVVADATSMKSGTSGCRDEHHHLGDD
jgi:hypothetical protein